MILALMVLAGGGGYWLGQNHPGWLDSGPRVEINRSTPTKRQTLNFDLFWDVWDRLEASFIDRDEMDSVKMVYGAISGMVASLGDPYTVFLPPQDNQRAEEDLAGAFGGVGIQLGFVKERLAVIAPLTDTPADKAGLEAGDFILAVDGKDVTEMNLPQVVNLIRGEIGSKVVLKIFREGEAEPREVELVRELIVVRSAEVDFVTDWCGRDNCLPVAHLKLTRFGERTNGEWKESIEEIRKECPLGECLGIVLDLRNNPGGYLNGAVFMAGEFEPAGVVVYQENASGARESYSIDRQGGLYDYPLVVLVNQGSASASEILAGFLKESERAKVVGENTFGKGSIQEPQDLEGGAGLHITTARWLLPSGQPIDNEGIKPDFEVENNPEEPLEDAQLRKAIEVLAG